MSLSETPPETPYPRVPQPEISWLFNTGAVNIASDGRAFFNTGGKISPFYTNIEFLVGGRGSSQEILSHIDELLPKERRGELPGVLMEKLSRVYESDATYRDVVNYLASMIINFEDLMQIEQPLILSGGERRDWLFGSMVAGRLERPYLYIFEDGNVHNSQGEEVTLDKGTPVLNITDQIIEGSSYRNLLCPSIRRIGGKLIYSIAVVDRNQPNLLSLAGITTSDSVFTINRKFLDEAVAAGKITESRKQSIISYQSDPDETMRQFLLNNPDFLIGSISSSDSQTRKPAIDFIQNDPYGLRGIEWFDQLLGAS